MSESTLHLTPRFHDVVREQVRTVGLSIRREALVFVVVLAIATLPVVLEIIHGGPGFDSSETFPTFIVSFLMPFAVWRGERRFGPAFLWTVPVDRRRMALAKVLAGGVWMLAALAFYVAWLMTLALFAHAPAVQILVRIPLIATIGAYLLGSALVLGLRHSLRWLFGAAGLVVVVGNFIQPYERQEPLRSGFATIMNAANAFQTLPGLAQLAIVAVLWLGAGLVALWIAVSRHGERRRH